MSVLSFESGSSEEGRVINSAPIPHKSSATCFGTLFLKPVFKSPKPCVSAFGTGNSCNSSTTMQLKNISRISSNCSFQISRVSNQNWLHLCHDRLWFSGDVGIFSHLASTTT